MRYYDASQLVGIYQKSGLKKSKDSILKRAAKECWQFVLKGKQGGQTKVFDFDDLPADIQLLIVESKKQTVIKEHKSLQTIKTRNKEVGLIKSYIISLYNKCAVTQQKFCELYNNDLIDVEEKAKKEYPNIDNSTFGRWLRQGDTVAELATKYGTKRKGAGEKTLSVDDKQILRALYLNTQKWTMKKCYRKFIEEFNGLVSYDVIKRYLNSIPDGIKVKLRYGSNTFKNKYVPFLTRKTEDVPVMDCWFSDHHMLDAFCVITHSNGKKSVIRPWITVFSDQRTRKIVGYHVSINPSTYSILMALKMAILRFGAPKKVYFDNGKDFKSKMLQGYSYEFTDGEIVKITGILESFGIDVTFAQKFHGQAKPVERWFGHVVTDFSCELPTFVGSNTAISLEEHKANWGQIKSNIKLTFEELETEFCKWIEKYNSKWEHSGRGMNNRTPNDVFDEEYKNWTRIDIPEDYMLEIFSEQIIRTVRQDGIYINKIGYYNPELILHVGKRVVVKRCIDDMSRIKVFDIDGIFLCEADNSILLGTGIAKEDIERVNKTKKKANKILKDYFDLKDEIDNDKISSYII